ncbi:MULTISPECIES: bifunctional 2-polyprenyl-6-hydroxyphenol methylase/3-demethylubiquinol 3-O-methyltransferase UbiG [unclassified Duganella]|uniref:class I SAM-dependent methyltransferase n=1 Tax=unclassified Duganella TaxID=2636909 RepID=UPI000873BA58|nr:MULTISPECIES: class I SAM-dependent methyltransferase [unclassified Duganella]OEZ63848.1 trans-aconitate 2-methyltransferase [Duganella sp. HH105]OFA06999.1 trans-aconitate 2-methyltransferase [Duganella sp. HH101]
MTTSSAAGADYFQTLYQQDTDPWKVRQRWYEQRKRSLLLANLPQQRYRRAFEPACGNGELTAELAHRAEHVTASDMSAEAVRLARQRMQREDISDASRVTLLCQRMPQDWPGEARFDLIVISEMLYYLNAEEVLQLRERCTGALAAGGTLLLCHWRPDFADRLLGTDEAHAIFEQAPALHKIVRHVEDDFLLEVWSGNAASVAQREGLQR